MLSKPIQTVESAVILAEASLKRMNDLVGVQDMPDFREEEPLIQTDNDGG
jgi:hypothetical protein